MADEPMTELVLHTEQAIAALRKLTEQFGAVTVGAAESVLAAAAHPTNVTGTLRRGAEGAVDVGLVWVEPVRRLSEEQRCFAAEISVWADRNRKFAEEVAAWAEAQQAFAERLEAWTSPLLTISEEFGAAMKTMARVVLPAGGANGTAEE